VPIAKTSKAMIDAALAKAGLIQVKAAE